MARPWIKLYTEMLQHEGVIELSDSAYRRFVELLLLAGVRDRDGFVGSFKNLLRNCYVDIETLTADLAELEAIEVIHQDDDGYHVTDWYQWQPENTDADRARNYRARKKAKHTRNVTATGPSRDASRTNHALDKNRIDKKREEGDAHVRKNGASAAPSASPPLPEVPEGGSNHAKTFKAITGFWVGTNMQDFLQQRLGERPDWDTVGWAYEQWISRGYNPRNLRGVLDWYDKRLADPLWAPDGVAQRPTAGPDFGQVFEDGFTVFANRRKKMDDADIPAYAIAAVNELGRGRFQNCTDRDRPFLKAEFVKVAAKFYGQVPA